MRSDEEYRLYRKLKVDYKCLELQFKILENRVKRAEWENLFVVIINLILAIMIWSKIK